MGFSVRFWGVRGTIPCPADTHLAFGGNTSCVEVRTGSERIILDAGTGIRMLGKRLLDENALSATLLLSHTHLDHISGFPFFSPAFTPGFQLRVMAGHLFGSDDIRSTLARQMSRPLFPVPLHRMGADIHFEDFAPGNHFLIGDETQIRTAPLRHPDGAVGYRIEYRGRSIAYVTDTEHEPGKPNQTILDLINNVDLLMYDSTYTDDEFPSKVGWGHSTWQEATRLASLARVKQLALFHHEPDRNDQEMTEIEHRARLILPNAFAAREGTVITLL
ncbi:Lactamase_B domain-containing protein [Azospirillaceae bacterium]